MADTLKINRTKDLMYFLCVAELLYTILSNMLCFTRCFNVCHIQTTLLEAVCLKFVEKVFETCVTQQFNM